MDRASASVVAPKRFLARVNTVFAIQRVPNGRASMAAGEVSASRKTVATPRARSRRRATSAATSGIAASGIATSGIAASGIATSGIATSGIAAVSSDERVGIARTRSG